MKKLNKDLLVQLETKMVENKVLKLDAEGNEIEITIETKFLNTKIEALITELLELGQYANENNIIEFDSNAMFFVLLFKTFTDVPYIEKGTVEERLENYVRTTNVLKNLECGDGESVFSKVINSFEKEQLEKINKKMIAMTKNINEFVSKNKDVNESISSQEEDI